MARSLSQEQAREMQTANGRTKHRPAGSPAELALYARLTRRQRRGIRDPVKRAVASISGSLVFVSCIPDGVLMTASMSCMKVIGFINKCSNLGLSPLGTKKRSPTMQKMTGLHFWK